MKRYIRPTIIVKNKKKDAPKQIKSKARKIPEEAICKVCYRRINPKKEGIWIINISNKGGFWSCLEHDSGFQLFREKVIFEKSLIEAGY